MLQESTHWFDLQMADGGPVYMETEPGRFLVEPWNSLSSLLMLIPALWWLWKIRGQIGHFRFMLFAIIMVILGGLGSAFFHGFRVSLVFLLMDIIPSAILTLSLSIFLWLNVLKRWWHIFFILVPAFGIRFLFWDGIPEHLAINLSYFITGVIIALPLMIILIKQQFKGWIIILLVVVSFIVALIFRHIDPVRISYLPMGTHFLWHSFSAVGTYFILNYLYIFQPIK
jgi:hemolysin III